MKKKLIPGVDYVIRQVALPTAKVDGCVVSDCDGCHTIVLNRNVCEKRRKEALKHELDHIENDDLYSDDHVSVIEERRK